jgi:hypothetical protein
MRYAIVKDGKVVNVVEAEPEFALNQNWVECPVGTIGWDYDGVSFINNLPEPVAPTQPAEPTKEELMQQLQALSERIQSLT